MQNFITFFMLIIVISLWNNGVVVNGEENNNVNAASILRNLTENDVDNVFASSWKPLTVADLSEDLRTWKPPEFFAKNYPCYLSGFDYEDRPIWIAELGKYDMLKLVNMGPKVLKEFEIYCKYAARLWTDSHSLKNPDGETLSLLLDFDGLRLVQYAQLHTIRFLLKLARDYVKLFEEHFDVIVVINVNYVTETLINIVKPVLGSLFARAEIYGNNRAQWLPRVLRHFPRESLPEWYGGYKNFTPIQVIG